MPTAVKVLRGSHKRYHNPREPQHEPIRANAPPPAMLDDDPIAAAEWTRLVGTLSLGHCTTVDRAALLAYCVQYSRWQQLETRARRGNPAVNTAVPMAQKALTLMLRCAAELGITPTARARIIAVAPLEPSKGVKVDEFTAFQRQRRAQ